MATRRVLIVDDEADVRSALADILRAMRYADTLEVAEASDGQEGLNAVLAQRPDLILLDLQMPRVSGLALLKQIHQADRRLPIIVITATQDTKLAAEALGQGAVAYLPKPFDPRHVEMLVATFLDATKRLPAKPPETPR
jgi:DNA-binding NtrC family response regulator